MRVSFNAFVCFRVYFGRHPFRCQYYHNGNALQCFLLGKTLWNCSSSGFLVFTSAWLIILNHIKGALSPYHELTEWQKTGPSNGPGTFWCFLLNPTHFRASTTVELIHMKYRTFHGLQPLYQLPCFVNTMVADGLVTRGIGLLIPEFSGCSIRSVETLMGLLTKRTGVAS